MFEKQVINTVSEDCCFHLLTVWWLRI